MQAKRGLDRLYGVLDDLSDTHDTPYAPGLLDAFNAALSDDLNVRKGRIKRIQ